MSSPNLLYIESNSFSPYYNFALEKYLFDNIKSDEIILYLWQNQNTVVCGRNQNVYNECHISRLLEDGGHIARRLSGGGAVYHDLGNLNFTFIANSNLYDLERQTDVILAACQNQGVNAIKNGRNDITVNDRKFSGNAFYKNNGTEYQHGTLMVDVDSSMLSNYLNVSREKLESKGVNSVKSRVINLKDVSKDITIASLKSALKESFQETYASKCQTINITEIANKIIKSNETFFASDSFIYGNNKVFKNIISKRFPWGSFELNVNVKGNTIIDSIIYSDALDVDFIQAINDKLNGNLYTTDSLCSIINSINTNFPNEAEACNDIKQLLKDSI